MNRMLWVLGRWGIAIGVGILLGIPAVAVPLAITAVPAVRMYTYLLLEPCRTRHCRVPTVLHKCGIYCKISEGRSPQQINSVAAAEKAFDRGILLYDRGTLETLKISQTEYIWRWFRWRAVGKLSGTIF